LYNQAVEPITPKQSNRNMFKSTTSTSPLLIAAAAVVLMMTFFFTEEHQQFPSTLASQHVRSRMSRMLHNNDVSLALFQPQMETVLNIDSIRNNAMISHIQSRRQRSNNGMEQIIGCLDKTTEMATFFFTEEHLPAALASQHSRSRVTRMLHNNDVSLALFRPQIETVVNIDSNRNNAMLSHIQSRRQRGSNRIEQMIGSLNTTTERIESQQHEQKHSSVISSIHHACILPQSI
jgi:hypothetical protein